MTRPTMILGAVIALALGASCDDGQPRFGPPGGLRVTSEPCPLPPGADGKICPEWSTVVYPVLEKYACTSAGCHYDGEKGDTPYNQPLIPPGDPVAAYDNLSAYENYSRPYVQANGQAQAFILCNLQQQYNFIDSNIMPPGSALSAADLAVIGNWVACGMQQLGGTPGTGGAGGQPATGGAGGS